MFGSCTNLKIWGCILHISGHQAIILQISLDIGHWALHIWTLEILINKAVYFVQRNVKINFINRPSPYLSPTPISISLNTPLFPSLSPYRPPHFNLASHLPHIPISLSISLPISLPIYILIFLPISISRQSQYRSPYLSASNLNIPPHVHLPPLPIPPHLRLPPDPHLGFN